MNRLCALFFLLLSPRLVFAHAFDGAGGFVSGITHPVLGHDHLLAMISVGILSAQIGGRAIWSVPATFVGVMLIGGVAGILGLPLISVEDGIALSVFALGLVIALEHKLPVMFAMIFVGFFAVFHGHAHGVEMPEIAQPVLYATGFVIGTTVIHIAGVAIGHYAVKTSWSSNLLRAGGGVIALIGLMFIFRIA